MDPLSDLLALLRPVAAVSSGFRAGGDWSIEFSGQAGTIKCYAILAGACWLAFDGVQAPIRLEQGQAFVLPRGQTFRLASSLDLPPIPSSALFPPAEPGGTVVLGAGEGFALAGARFAIHGGHAGSLLRLLPAAIHLRNADDNDVLRWAVERMIDEMRSMQPGAHLLAQNLAHMMLVHALRSHLARLDGRHEGWLAGLSDPRLRRALEAMHAAPAERWQLARLARIAGMSRTVFATRFRDVIGETAMQYLTRWRMALACDRLERNGDPVATLAEALGYESFSAFSTAFKRHLGCSPQQYKTAAQQRLARPDPVPVRSNTSTA